MTQYVINIGAIPNDGTGDPLRTAFNETNLNFDQVFAAGPVLSNIRIANNTILTTTTNGNLILAPNGIGRIQANATIVPSVANVRDLGSATQRWNTVYTQYLDLSGVLTTGDLIVDGNLTVQGNTIQIGNIVTDTKTIQLANTASNASSANGAGITVGVNDNIATLLYNSTGNTWTTNIGISSVGNISAPYFVGNGSLLTGLAATYGNANVATFLANFGSNTISTTGNITSNGLVNVNRLRVNQTANAWSIAGNIISAPSGGSWNSDPEFLDEYITSAPDGYINLTSLYANSNVASQLHLEHGLAQIVVDNGSQYIWEFDDSGNLTVPGNIIPAANAVYSLGNSTNYWANLWVANNTIYIGGVALGMTAGNVLTVNGNAVLTNGSNTAVSTTGNITAGNIGITGGNLTWANASIVQTSASDLSITGDGQVTVRSLDGTYQWTFDSNGNLTAPGNVSATGNVTGNYFFGDGSQLTGISANTGNVTFSGEAVIGTGTSNTQSGLYLAPDPVSLANDLYLRVRGNILDEPTHIHFDTGNNQYYNLIIGDDNKYIQLANTGNIVINTNNYAGNTAQWNFSTDGTLTLPAGSSRITSYGQITIETDNNASGMYLNADSVNLLYANANVTLRANSIGTNKDWNFGNTGVLTLPNADATGFGNIYFEENSSTITFGLDDNATPYLYSFATSGITLPRGGATIRDTVGNAVAFGRDAAATGPQGNAAVAIGQQAGDTSQGANAVAIGYQAGLNTQGVYSVAIGSSAGAANQGVNSVAIGTQAGQITQGQFAVAIGDNAGNNAQGTDAVAIGGSAGLNTQGAGAVALGQGTGETSQGANAVALGKSAGQVNQGINSVAIGQSAGQTNQANNSIILNATGSALDQTTANTFTVAPVRNDNSNIAEVMFYNTTSKEITYGNTISVSGNIKGGNLVTAGSGGDITLTGGNITGANVVSANTVSATGNVQITSSGNTWLFDTTGNLTFPTGNLIINPDNTAFSNAAVIASVNNLVTLSTGANGGLSSLWVEDLANIGTSNIAAVYANPVPGSGNVRIAVGTNGGGGPNLWDFDTTGNLTAPGNISATGNITGNYFIGNGSQLTGITASVPSQTILPTIQTITVSDTSGVGNAGGGGSAFANVTVANTIPVTEYGVIITSGTSSQKYATGALGSIPGTVKLNFTTGLNNTPFTVYAYVTSNAGTYYSDSATGTSGICLLAGTQIALSDGTRKAIEHITYTDKMLSWDFDRGCYAETTALWIKRGETGSQYNLLTFSDGTTLRTFDQHRIFNKQAGAFTYPMTDATPIGTVTVNEHGQEITLTNKQVIVDTIEYYNVITDHHMNLFSDTVLTSCRFNNIYPITDMKFVKDGRTLRTRAEFENIPDRFFYGLRLAEQTTDIETVEWYVNRLLSTEVSTESELTV
jgi:hypothetical protein